MVGGVVVERFGGMGPGRPPPAETGGPFLFTPAAIPTLGHLQRISWVDREVMALDSRLDAVHDGQMMLGGGLHLLDRPVEPVVIGDGERPVSQLGGHLDEFIGMRGAIEKRVIRVTVQLGVFGSHLQDCIEHMFASSSWVGGR